MTPDPNEHLQARAERGQVRGPDRVWTAALHDLAERPAAARRVWLPPMVAAVAIVSIVLVVPFALQLAGRSEPAARTTPPAGTSPTAKPPSPAPSTTPAAKPAPDRPIEDVNATYLACARARGFDPRFVEVLDTQGHFDPTKSDKPIWVKTAREVPAEVHRPCFVQIGGDDPLASSTGQPTALGECAGVDRTPPIKWSPAPTNTRAGSPFHVQDGEVSRGESVTVSWSSRAGEQLEVPVDLLVECWNGQGWTPAYFAKGFNGTTRNATAIEVAPGLKASSRRAIAADSPLSIPVPRAAPDTTYRVVASAAWCSSQDGSCRQTPLRIEFVVAQ